MIAGNVGVSVKGSPSPQIFAGVVSFGRSVHFLKAAEEARTLQNLKSFVLCPMLVTAWVSTEMVSAALLCGFERIF